MNNFDVIIIGGGPGGVSAALYTARAGLSTCIIYMDEGELGRAHIIENYYGLPAPVSGSELFKNGLAQAAAVGANIVNAEVTSVDIFSAAGPAAGGFSVEATGQTYTCRALILCMGKRRSRPKIQGLSALEGRGVSYCAVCDGFFYRGAPVAVLGGGAYALSECAHLLPLASSVTLLTDGINEGINESSEPPSERPDSLAVNTAKIEKLLPGEDGMLAAVQFENGSKLNIQGLFVAVGTASHVSLAAKMGCLLNGDSLAVDENFATNVPGIFAAGDCTGRLMQVSAAVGEGAAAGLAAVKHLKATG